MVFHIHIIVQQSNVKIHVSIFTRLPTTIPTSRVLVSTKIFCGLVYVYVSTYISMRLGNFHTHVNVHVHVHVCAHIHAYDHVLFKFHDNSIPTSTSTHILCFTFHMSMSTSMFTSFLRLCQRLCPSSC